MTDGPSTWEGTAEDDEFRERAAEADDTLAPGSMPPEDEPPFEDDAPADPPQP